jgi:hypothetical protein
MTRQRALLLAMALLLLAARASATPPDCDPATPCGSPVVYHDHYGAPCDASIAPTLGPLAPYSLPPNARPTLCLYVDYQNDLVANESSGGGTMCVDEDGDETCAFDVRLEIESEDPTYPKFESFAPPTGLPATTKIEWEIEEPARRTLRVNGIDASGMAIPAPVGTVTLDRECSTPCTAQVFVRGPCDGSLDSGCERQRGSMRVGAAGQLDAIQEQVIAVAVPEPDRTLLLACGLAGLALLARLRRRRLAARA